MKFRTIILEDERAIRELLEIACRLRNHEVLSFPSPIFCRLSLGDLCSCEEESTCCDVIITDQMMPDMTGIEFIELLRRNNCLVPNMALVTASHSDGVTERAADLDCHVIRKPFQMAEFVSWLAEAEGRVMAGRRLMPKEMLFR
jgi:CheY-like chemotaxis protein